MTDRKLPTKDELDAWKREAMRAIKHDLYEVPRVDPNDLLDLVFAVEEWERLQTDAGVAMVSIPKAEYERLTTGLREWQEAAQLGHPSPCTLGPLCPFCEIERLSKKLRFVEKMNSTSLANNLCPDHRDKQYGKPCLACEIERLTSAVADLEGAQILNRNAIKRLNEENAKLRKVAEAAKAYREAESPNVLPLGRVLDAALAELEGQNHEF